MPSIPGVRLGTDTGLPDSSWVTDVRDALRDYPQWYTDTRPGDGVNGVVGAAATPFTTSKKPIYDIAAAPYLVSATVDGSAQTLSTDNPPTGTNKMFVNYNTGEIVFNVAPASGKIVNVAYPVVKWTDQAILTALYAGLRLMFPRVGKTYVDTSITLGTNQWDYQLPAAFDDPRARIEKVEVQSMNSSTEPYRELRAYERTGTSLLTIPSSQYFAPTGQLRITYWGPYLSLGDLEPQLYHLPVWYACSVLLAKQEAVRSREDQGVPPASEGGMQPLTMLNIAKDYERRFMTQLDELKRVYGPGFKRRVISSYELSNGVRG